MTRQSAILSLVFSSLGHALMHLLAAFYFVIVLALESAWDLPYHELLGLWTLGALLIGIGALPSGWLADRWSLTNMMVVFFIGMGAASIACGFATGPTSLMLGLTALGLFAAIYHPVGIPWVVKNAKSRGKALGINGIFGNVGVAGAGLVAGLLIDIASWRAAFIVPGVICVLAGLALWFCIITGRIVDPKEDVTPQAPAKRGDMMRAFGVLLLTIFLMGIVYQSTQAALPKVFDLRLRGLAGEGAFGIGIIVAAVYTVGGVMQVIGGHLADRYPLKYVYIGAWLVQIPVLMLVATLGGLPLIFASMLTVMIAASALPAENLLLARYAPERHRSLVFGAKFVLAFGAAPVALQMVAMTQARTGEFFWLFAVLAVVAVVAMIAAFILPNGDRRRAVAPERQQQPAE